MTPANALALQRLLGNRVVAGSIGVQRQGPDAGVPAAAPGPVPIPYPGGTPDAGSLPGGVAETPRQILDRALRERTSAAITAITDFSAATDADRIALINILVALGGTLSLTDQLSVRRIWQSWGTRLPVMGVEQSALWERCNVAGAALPESWLGAAAGHRDISLPEQVGGTVYGVSGAYDYRIKADSIVVSVGMNFTPDAGVTVPTATWFGYITSTWNRYDAVNLTDPTQTKRIEFRPVAGAGHNIQVSGGDGRANAGHYYTGDSRAPQTIPHEFGHLIGLEDEYERDAADYARVTEGAVPAGSGDRDTARTIATALHDAVTLSERVFEWHSTCIKRRRAAVEAVLAANHIVADYQRGENPLTREVAAQYLDIYGHDFSADVMDRIEVRWSWEDADALQAWREQILGTFQYTNTSLMGDMSEHGHPVAPRHVRAFAQIIQTFFGHGNWQPKER